MPPDVEPTPAAPPPPATRMIDRSGAVVQVPLDQAAQAYASGALSFVKGDRVQVVGADGTVGHVDAEHAGHVLSSGGRLASPEEYRTAELEGKHGGLAGSLAATGEGAARGLTLGLSDPLAVGAARFFGGDKKAEEVRTHLAEEKEAHPYLATAGEVGGAALPVLLSGGAAAPEEAAALGAEGAARGGAAVLGAADDASTIASLSRGVQTLGALPRGVSALGEGAEHVVSGMLGTAAESSLGRAGQAAARSAIRGIVEGGLFGAGQEVSDATLENVPLTAENLMSSVGHGALMGGALGFGLGAVGSLAKDAATTVLSKVSPELQDAAHEQTWKWLDPSKAASAEAEKRAGGASEVGRTVFEDVLKPLVEEKGLAAAALNPEEKLELVQKAIDRKGKAIGELIEGNAHAQVPMEELLKPIDTRIAEWSGKVGGEDKVAHLERLKASVARVLAPGERASLDETLSGLTAGSPEHEAALAQAGYAKRTPAELAAHIQANPEVLGTGGPLPISATHVAPPPAGETMIPITQAIEQRRALQQLAFQESKSLDPKLRVQLLRDISGDWNRLEEETLNKATAESGALAGTQLRELNKDFQRLKIAEKALEENTARYQTNRNLSLSDYLMGAAHAPAALMGGHPLVAAGDLALSVGHKALRAHGNAFAALALDRLATYGGVSRAVAESTAATDAAVDSFMAKKAEQPAVRAKARPFRVTKGATTTTANDNDRRFEKEEARVRQLSALAPGLAGAHLKQRTAPIAMHAPAIAQGVQATAAKANSFLSSKLPPSAIAQAGPSLTPQLAKQQTSAADRAKFLRYVDAVEGGPPAIMKRLAAGKITPEDVETFKQVYPASFQEVRTKIAQKCAERKTPLTYGQRLQLGTSFDLPLDATMTQPFVTTIQRGYEAQNAQAEAASKAAASPQASRTSKPPSFLTSTQGPFSPHGGA